MKIGKPVERRPGFSRAGYLRRISMSYHASLFIIVEGVHQDRYFVDRICRSSESIRGKGHEIRNIKQIRQVHDISSGGKSAVLSFYDYCRRSNKLVQSNSGGLRSICFFVDRDGQHITGGMRRSPHVIYTLLADTEAHAFSDSDEVEALATAASLDRQTAQNALIHMGDWKRALADSWRCWIEECYVAEAVKSRCWVGFGSATSQVHTGEDSRVLDETALKEARCAVESSALIKGDAYRATRIKVLGKIARVYESGHQTSLLKGKWMPTQITHSLDDYFRSLGWRDGWNKNSFRSSVTHCYLAHLNVSAPNVNRLRISLENLIGT